MPKNTYNEPPEMPPPPLDVRDLGQGRAWLRVNQAVEWDTAVKVLTLLKGS